MHALITHPFIQVFLAPFLVAILTAEIMQRLRLSGLAILAGFAITVYLISGFTYTPNNGTQKIIWLVLVSGVIAIPLALINWSLWRPVLAVLAAASTLWIGQRILLQIDVPTALLWGLGSMLYVGWVVYWMDKLDDSPVRSASAGIALGLGVGATLFLAGLSLLGKLNFAVGAAALGYLFIMFVSNSLLPCGRTYTLPLSIITATSSSLAVLSGRLPWYTLIPFALIPLLALLPVSQRYSVAVQATLLSLATLMCAAVSVYLSGEIHGWPNF